MTIYISGKISGIEKKARRKFKKVQKHLEKIGFSVINPFDIGDKMKTDPAWTDRQKWQHYMRVDIAEMLSHANGILLMDNWKDSEGAKEECRIAQLCGIEIFKEGEL